MDSQNSTYPFHTNHLIRITAIAEASIKQHLFFSMNSDLGDWMWTMMIKCRPFPFPPAAWFFFRAWPEQCCLNQDSEYLKAYGALSVCILSPIEYFKHCKEFSSDLFEIKYVFS
jgi:hypothetical protein